MRGYVLPCFTQRNKKATKNFLVTVLHLLKRLFTTKMLRILVKKYHSCIHPSDHFARHVQNQKQTIEQSVESIPSYQQTHQDINKVFLLVYSVLNLNRFHIFFLVSRTLVLNRQISAYLMYNTNTLLYKYITFKRAI